MALRERISRYAKEELGLFPPQDYQPREIEEIKEARRHEGNAIHLARTAFIEQATAGGPGVVSKGMYQEATVNARAQVAAERSQEHRQL